MTPGSLSFAANDWLWPAVLIFALGLLLILWSYARTGLSRGLRITSALLKAIGLALLLTILLEPTWTTTRPREGANLFAIVADNSIGMNIRDPGERYTRGESMLEMLSSDQSDWLAKLEEMFVVRRYLFDSRLDSARDFGALNFEGRESALGHALKSVAERFQGQPLAGVLVFTDGNATDLAQGFEQSGLPPVYPVIIGEDSGLSDIAVNNASASQTVFEDAPVTLSASISVAGFGRQRIRAQVLSDNKVIEEKILVAKNEGEDLPVRFELKPEQPGISFYELRASLADTLQTNLTEATHYNNSRLLMVDRGRGPHRILYVSGRPNWEYKFMNRAVSEDPELQLVGLIRIARREPKFTFRGRAGESSNPLFRGFHQEAGEEVERYDQPVLIRLNTKDETELLGGFPKTPEDLYGFEGVILDDIEADFFTPEQLLLMQRYVSERGGGFLMLGGVDTLQHGKYLRTPVGDMLPVYLDRLSEGRSGESYRLELTREGLLEPWIRLRATEQEERARLDEHSGYQVLNKLREVKPGASLLATIRDNLGNIYPAVAVQRFGNGRVGTISIGDLWRGSLRNEKAQEDLQKSWRQLLRWLIADVPRQCDIRIQPSPNGEGAIELLVRARDKNFDPVENANIQITVTPPGLSGETNVVTLTAEAADKQPGHYRAAYVPREPGPYRATATINDSSGVRLAEVETGWSSEPLAREFASLTPNRSLLEEIARKTEGEIVPASRLNSFVQGLSQKKAPILETYSYPVWHTPYVFILALGCFIAEWGIRRMKGLA